MWVFPLWKCNTETERETWWNFNYFTRFATDCNIPTLLQSRGPVTSAHTPEDVCHSEVSNCCLTWIPPVLITVPYNQKIAQKREEVHLLIIISFFFFWSRQCPIAKFWLIQELSAVGSIHINEQCRRKQQKILFFFFKKAGLENLEISVKS